MEKTKPSHWPKTHKRYRHTKNIHNILIYGTASAIGIIIGALIFTHILT